MLSMRLKPFFYIWHILPVIHRGLISTDHIFDSPTANFAACSVLLNVLNDHFEYDFQLLHTCEFILANTPVQCYNRISKNAFSQDGKWLAVKRDRTIKLLKKPDEGELSLECQKKFLGIEYHCFTNDSNFLLYVTQEPNPKLCAFSLETGATFQCIFRLSLGVCTSREDNCRYIFCDPNERVMISLGDLSGEFFLGYLNRITSKFTHPLEAIFTSTDTITFFFSNGILGSRKIGRDVLPSSIRMLELDYSQKINEQKCAVSHDGNFIAISRSCDLSLFSTEGKLLSSVCKITDQREHRPTACCLTFSPDDSLFLFCIEQSDNKQSFYVWDIEKERIFHLTDLRLPSKLPVDCCCFDQDNEKIFFCNASSVFMVLFPPEIGRSKDLSPRIGYYKSACSNCAVSSDNKLLVCCIASEILLHHLDGSNAFCKVPHKHLGKIECCRLLKRNRYLISCGIDGVVFLFDLSAWKSVAYTVAMQESIVTMSVSPDEDKVVCLGSSGKVSVVNLHGLKHDGLSSDFQLPEDCKY